MAFDFRYPNIPASDRGWGPGWTDDFPPFGATRPDSFPGDIVPLVVRGVQFVGGVRSEIRDLCIMLLEEALDEGYLPQLDNPGCWGGAFRSSKRSDGSPTMTPSNHSWYLAIDINAPHNVFGASTHQIPDDAAFNLEELFRKYGFRWLGPPIKDWMHFDFAGTPADAKAMTEKARAEGVGMALTDAQKEALSEAVATQNGVQDFLNDKEPADLPSDAHPARVRTLRALVRAASKPEPAPAGPHDHDDRYSLSPHVHGEDVGVT